MKYIFCRVLNIFLCSSVQEPDSFTLADGSNLAQVIIAFANLALAGYVIVYQIDKDKKSDNDTAKLNEQNIKLQWFKELIVQPNMPKIMDFYSNLNTIDTKINSNDLTENEKQDINDFVKAELSKLRKSFVEILFLVDKSFADQLMANLDGLVDDITNAIFNEELKLKNFKVYEKNIGSKISTSKSKVISQLYNYRSL